MQDPSCLLSRVLYEISSTVCIQVSPTELTEFGVVYDPSDRKEDDEKSAEDTKGHKKKRRRGRRQKLEFKVEETNENQVLCKKVATFSHSLVKYGGQKRFGGWTSNWNQMDQDTGDGDAFLLGGTRMSGFVSSLSSFPVLSIPSRTKNVVF